MPTAAAAACLKSKKDATKIVSPSLVVRAMDSVSKLEIDSFNAWPLFQGIHR